MPERRIAIIGALLGAFASAYLLVDYVFGSGICLTGSGCDVVRASAFAYPLGIPMPLFGLAFYLAAVALLLRASAPLAGVPGALVAAGWAVAGLAVMSLLTAHRGIRDRCAMQLVPALGRRERATDRGKRRGIATRRPTAT